MVFLCENVQLALTVSPRITTVLKVVYPRSSPQDATWRRTAITDEIRYIYKSLKAQGTKIILQWVPSHVGLQGNEQADFLAKKALQ